MLTPTRLREFPFPLRMPDAFLGIPEVYILTESFHPSFTTCRITEKDIKTFCSEDESLHL